MTDAAERKRKEEEQRRKDNEDLKKRLRIGGKKGTKK